jgi:AcrR family transcriptional regulator
MSAERETQMMDAARELFFSRGMSATSMDDVARHTGVSKATIYRRFTSKEEMFAYIVLNSAEKVSASFACITLDEENPIASLRQSALALHKQAYKKEAISLMRQLIAEANNFPKLSQQARDIYIQSVIKRLTHFFTSLIKKGLMKHNYPQQAAISFVTLCTGNLRPLLNAVISKKDELKRMESELEVFIKGCELKNPEP